MWQNWCHSISSIALHTSCDRTDVILSPPLLCTHHVTELIWFYFIHCSADIILQNWCNFCYITYFTVLLLWRHVQVIIVRIQAYSVPSDTPICHVMYIVCFRISILHPDDVHLGYRSLCTILHCALYCLIQYYRYTLCFQKYTNKILAVACGFGL